jgi:glutaredoxin
MDKVIIYSASWCVPCQAAKRWFDDKGIAYIEKQVDDENDPSILKEFTDAGYRATPTIIINDQVIVGNSPKKFQEALAM